MTLELLQPEHTHLHWRRNTEVVINYSGVYHITTCTLIHTRCVVCGTHSAAANLFVNTNQLSKSFCGLALLWALWNVWKQMICRVSSEAKTCTTNNRNSQKRVEAPIKPNLHFYEFYRDTIDISISAQLTCTEWYTMVSRFVKNLCRDFISLQRGQNPTNKQTNNTTKKTACWFYFLLLMLTVSLYDC